MPVLYDHKGVRIAECSDDLLDEILLKVVVDNTDPVLAFLSLNEADKTDLLGYLIQRIAADNPVNVAAARARLGH